MKILLFSIIFFTLSFKIYAGCYCACMNGVNQPICSSTLDLPPICPPKVCAIAPPAIKPLDSLRIPPIGTKRCTNEQVYNEYTRRYEWKEICY